MVTLIISTCSWRNESLTLGLLKQWFPTGNNLATRRHLAISRTTIFGCCSLGGEVCYQHLLGKDQGCCQPILQDSLYNAQYSCLPKITIQPKYHSVKDYKPWSKCNCQTRNGYPMVTQIALSQTTQHLGMICCQGSPSERHSVED